MMKYAYIFRIAIPGISKRHSSPVLRSSLLFSGISIKSKYIISKDSRCDQSFVEDVS